MSLLTPEQKAKIPALYTQEEVSDPTVYLIIRCMNAFWLITEYDAEKDLAFGWADMYGDGSCGELGYIHIGEIEELKDTYAVSVNELEKPLSKVKERVYS